MNEQAVERKQHLSGYILDIIDVFYTIQGEGPFSGHPAVFLRCSGCNLSSVCHSCDTSYTKGRRQVHKDEIALLVQKIFNDQQQPAWSVMSSLKLVVITGGEPFRQNITPLVTALLGLDYLVQIETNGTYFLEDFPYGHLNLHIVLSPKTPKIQKFYQYNLANKVKFKYILKAGEVDPADGLPLSSLGSGVRPARPSKFHPRNSIYVQPQDDDGDIWANTMNVQAAVESCMKFGYRLSLQQHKFLDLP